MRPLADTAGIDLLAIDDRAAHDGLRAWHDAGLWLRSKQEVTLPAAPMYGELVARIAAAHQGRAFKCLVLDLDNTLWGGVIGDDGMDGIVIGQGSPLGEAFLALQDYAREQARRIVQRAGKTLANVPALLGQAASQPRPTPFAFVAVATPEGRGGFLTLML